MIRHAEEKKKEEEGHVIWQLEPRLIPKCHTLKKKRGERTIPQRRPLAYNFTLSPESRVDRKNV